MLRSAAVLTLALVLRIGVLAGASRLPTFTHYRLDELVYHDAGVAIARGDLALGREVFHMSPGYSYFVGAVYAIAGDGPWPIRTAQLLLGLAIVTLVMASARRLLGEPWGTVAGIAAAVYGPLPFYETLLLAATLSVFAYALVLWLALRALAAPGVARWAGVGLALGLAALVRPSALVLGVPLAVAAWRSSRRGVLPLVLATLAMVAPATLRNLVVAGEPVAVTDSGGLNFFIGNGKGAIGTFRIPRNVPDAGNANAQFRAFRAFAERKEGRALGSREVDAFWYGVAWSHMRSDPGGWLRLMARKLALYVNRRELPNTEDYAFSRGVNPALGLPLLGFGVLAPFAFVGTLLMLGGREEERLVGWLNVVTCLAVIAFFVLAHYRVSAVPGAIVAAAYALRRLHAERRPARSAALVVAIAAATVLACLPTGLPDDRADAWFKLGYAYHVEGRLEDAERCYRRAADLGDLDAAENLARLYDREGRADAGREAWRRAAELADAAGDRRRASASRQHLER